MSLNFYFNMCVYHLFGASHRSLLAHDLYLLNTAYTLLANSSSQTALFHVSHSRLANIHGIVSVEEFGNLFHGGISGVLLA